MDLTRIQFGDWMALEHNHIVRLYQKGFSCEAIAMLDGRSRNTIRSILLSEGVTIRSRSESNRRFPTHTAVKLYNLGCNAAQIGELLGVHQTTVVKRLRASGFPLRSHQVAMGVGFSDKEFSRFFLTDSFLDALNEVSG